jgi:hypothetical protein
MLISIINQTLGEISDAELLTVIRAINQQIEFDFTPYWSMPATVRLEGTMLEQPRANAAAAVMRGDAVVYLSSSRTKSNPEGFHDRNYRGIPYGVVYSEISEKMGDPWSVTLSHEVLELIADPQANNYVQGPKPNDLRKKVFFWFEMCDAVSSGTYEINGVALQNFLLPAYFEPPVPGARTNFLGTELRPFGIAPKSYVGYYNPETQQQETIDSDEVGKRRREIKNRGGKSRGARRRKA